MLKSLSITNFRCFPKYHMPGLARVNLLIGKNNSGKTAVLEAVHFLVEGADARILEIAAYRRGECRARADSTKVPNANFSHLFTSRRFSTGSQIEIEDEATGSLARLTLGPFSDPSPIFFGGTREEYPSFTIRTESSTNSESSFVYSMDTEGNVFIGPKVLPAPRDRSSQSPSTLIPTNSLDSHDLAHLWNLIVLKRLEVKVSDSLRLIDKRVEDVVFFGAASSFIEPMSARQGVLIGLDGQEKRSPIGSMGEGMWRIFCISAGLACSEDGTLLIDEVENGLHYSLFEDFWAYVVRMAVDLNVQVFATTHSNDCLQALSSLCESKPELAVEVAVHKLNAGFESSVPISGPELPSILYGGAEIR